MIRFQFEVIDALPGTFVAGPALLDANGKRIGQVVAREIYGIASSADQLAVDKRSQEPI